MDNKHLARIAIVTLLAIGCFLILQPFIAAVLFAIIICVTTWPLYAWLLGRLGGRPALTSSVMTLLLTQNSVHIHAVERAPDATAITSTTRLTGRQRPISA